MPATTLSDGAGVVRQIPAPVLSFPQSREMCEDEGGDNTDMRII